MRRWWLLLLFGLIVPLHAQENPPDVLQLDTPMQVSVTADAPAMLRYENRTPGTVLNIETHALSDDFDAVVWLVDADMHLLAYNDDARVAGEVERNAALSHVTLAESGLYTIFVDSFNGVSAGEVEVIIHASDVFAAQVTENDTTTIITANLPADKVFRYPLTLEAGAKLTLTARDTSGTLDPYLRIMDNSGMILAANDDHSSPDLTLNIFDARIAAWEAPETGTYTVEVVDFLGRAGEIEVRIEQR